MKSPARKHAHVAATLTHAELEAPFRIGAASIEPLPHPTRCELEWDGRRYAENDPATGFTLTVGEEA